jgi:hypothetical protein
MTHERAGRALAGTSILLFLGLGYFINSVFYIFVMAICFNLIQSAFTNKCIVKTILIRLGLPGEAEMALQEKQRMH